MSSALVRRSVPVDVDPVTLGQTLADSGYFQDAKQAAQAAVKVMAGAELGFGPIASMTGVYIVKGRVSLSANLMAAAIKRSGRYDYLVKQHTDQECSIDFLQGEHVIGTSSFSMKDAQTAGLASSDTWKKHPRNMLFARAMSNGAKWYCPDIFGGPIYTPDELGAEVDGETGHVLAEPPSAAPALPMGDPDAHTTVDAVHELCGKAIRERVLDGPALARLLIEHGAEPRDTIREALDGMTGEQRDNASRTLRDIIDGTAS